MEGYNKVFLSLGSNLGKREENLQTGLNALKNLKSINKIKISSIYLTSPVENFSQPDFLNCVVSLTTYLSPIALLSNIKDIERKFSLPKMYRYAPRLLDIDILLFGNLKLEIENLVIPHKQLMERLFYLLPLLELDKDVSLPDGSKVYRKFLDLKREKIYSCQNVKIW